MQKSLKKKGNILNSQKKKVHYWSLMIELAFFDLDILQKQNNFELPIFFHEYKNLILCLWAVFEFYF